MHVKLVEKVELQIICFLIFMIPVIVSCFFYTLLYFSAVVKHVLKVPELNLDLHCGKYHN